MRRWCLRGGFCFAEFFRGGTLAANAEYTVKSPEDLLELFVQMFANPVLEGDAGWAAYVFGAVCIAALFVLAYWICKRRLVSEYIFPISIIVFSLGSMFLVACSRGQLGATADVAAATQYAMYPAWLYVGVILLGFEIFFSRCKMVRQEIKVALSVVLYIFFMIISFGKFDVVKIYGDRSQAVAYVLQHWEEVPKQLKQDYVFPQDDIIENEALFKWLKENRLFLYGDDKQYEYPYSDYVIAELDHDFTLPETEETPGSFWIDYVNGEAVPKDMLTIDAKTGLDIAGWALDDAHAACPSGTFVKIADSFYKMKVIPRESVVNAFGNDGYLNSGFQGYISTSRLAPGTYEADIVVISADGQSYYEKPIFTFEITA